MKKKILSNVLVAACTLACLTGCGGGEASTGAVEKGATVINFYVRAFEDWSIEWMNNKVKEFNSILDDGIQVDVKFYEMSVYSTLLVTAQENNAMPDVFVQNTGAMYNFYKNGYCAPINDYFTQEQIDDILPVCDEYLLFEDEYYGYPWMLEPNSIFIYRKDMLEKANYSVPEDNIWTWDDLLEACAKVKPTLKPGQYTLGLPLGTESNYGLAGLAYNTTGGRPVSEDWMTNLVEDNEDYRDFYGLLYDLYNGGYCPLASLSASGYNDIIDAMCENKLAMTFCGSWSIAEIINNYPMLEDKIGVAVIPTRDGDITKTTSVNGGWNLCISKQSKHKEKAATFIKWLLCDDMERIADYFDLAAYSKSATTQSLQTYIEENTDFAHMDWLNTINSVSNLAISSGSFPGSILTAAYTTAVENIILNVGKNKDKVIGDSIAGAKSTIDSVISAEGYTSNPKYDKK